jgi:hypothetical protein
MEFTNSSMAIPPGKAMGCLPRKSKVGAVCPVFADHFEEIPESEWANYAGKISLRPFVKTVLDQDGVGSCAAESSTQSVMIGRAFAGLPHVVLNPWAVYHTTSGGRDQGSSIDDNLQYLREHGCPPESAWPRSKGWQAKPSAEAMELAKNFRIVEFYDITTRAQMVTCLLKGWPVVYGSKGHAVCKVEYLDPTKALDINSWATSWGDGGFGVWAKFSEINWQYGAFAVRTVADVSGD